MSLLFNTLPKFVIDFLPKSKLILWLQSPSTVILELKKRKSVTASIFPPSVPAMQETWAWSLGREDSLERAMAAHPSILAWRIPWTEEPGRLQSMGLQRIGQDWAALTFTFSDYYKVDHVFIYVLVSHVTSVYCVFMSFAQFLDVTEFWEFFWGGGFFLIYVFWYNLFPFCGLFVFTFFIVPFDKQIFLTLI